MLLAVGTLCLMAGCSSKVSKGIVSDATMNTVTIVTDQIIPFHSVRWMQIKKKSTVYF